MAGSGYRVAPALVRRSDGQVLQLAPLLFHALEVIDGQRGYPEIAQALGERINKQVAPAQAFTLVEKLRPLGLLAGPGGAQPALRRADPPLRLRFPGVVSNPALTPPVTPPFAPPVPPLLA